MNFVLEYQPIFDLEANRMTEAEALLRWDHPDPGTISPGLFIPMAERVGQIQNLGTHVLKTACRQFHSLSTGDDPVTLSVNLSSRHFLDEDLLEWLRDHLFELDFASESLQLDVTEHTIMQPIEEDQTVLQELKESGVSVAIDDFATGYSSFRYLTELPVDTLKIDRSFVQPLDFEADESDLAGVLCSVGHRLSLDLIAEGVETRRQLKCLREFGGQNVQGFLLGRPVSFDDLDAYLDSSVEELLAQKEEPSIRT